MAMRQYGNLETQKLHDRSKGVKAPADRVGKESDPEAEMMKDEGADGAESEHDHAGQDGEHDVIHGVAEEHGPAVAHEHTMEGEHHTVTSHHEDGHTHTSKGHPHAEHVHAHIGHALKVGNQETDEEAAGAMGGGDELASKGSALGL